MSGTIAGPAERRGFPVYLVRIEAPHFVAGLIVARDTGRVIRTAPILAWALGRHIDDLRPYCLRKRWTFTSGGPPRSQRERDLQSRGGMVINEPHTPPRDTTPP